MTLKIFDKLKAQAFIQEASDALDMPTSREVAGIKRAARQAPKAPPLRDHTAGLTDVERIKADFRLFVILLWRHLLGVDPAPIMLDMAYWLQHGPDRSIIMAFRGFSKSWITGAYALWRLYCDSEEKVLVVSGSLTRAVATTNWCLTLINTWPLLAHLKPLPSQRQSSKAFDVGPAKAAQSPSFHALGIGGQIVGFRGTCIIPDDVETQQNSLTVTMRDKVAESVKEFDSVLVPGGVIKFLGTPHDEDSLYSKLAKRGYTIRVWPALYPDADQLKGYGERLSPYILKMLEKGGPDLVGTPTMPTRFTADDLAGRRLSLGMSEFALQFMLDTSLSDRDKYPLKVKDLMVMGLDPRKGPESIVYSEDPKQRLLDLPVMGFEGDHYLAPIVPDGTAYSAWTRVIGFVDNSGRGADETALTILAELNGSIFFLKLYATKAGFEPTTLLEIARLCVQYRVHKLKIESNFGDGMFAALLKPVLDAEWKKHNATIRRGSPEEPGGTEIEEVRTSNTMAKERRILALLEPVTQQHRLVVAKSVVEWDYSSLQKIDGEDTRHRYALFHQYTHLTRERDSLHHDDRLDSLAGAVSDFADIIGVDPSMMSVRSSQERLDEEWEKLMGVDEEYGLPVGERGMQRAASLMPAQR